MKITRDKMFFSKDLIHTLAYVGMFVAAIISVGACKSGIWVAAILFARPFNKKFVQSYVLRNQDELTNYARKVIEEHPMEPLEWNGWKVYYYADDMVEFCTGSFGLVPSTTYKGFYYSEDDEPHGFQDVPIEFVKSGNGWSWAESEGDNTQYTERIAAHWYWYEAKF